MTTVIKRAVTINRPRADVYSAWRKLETLPRSMTHLKSVTPIDATHYHWVAESPVGDSVEWDAEIVQDVPNEYLAWRSLPGSQIPNRGEVRFADAPGGRGTEVHALFSYDPPAGAAGALIAKILGEDPDMQTREGLRRFKRVLETGEVPTTEGQPSGRERDTPATESPQSSAEPAHAEHRRS